MIGGRRQGRESEVESLTDSGVGGRMDGLERAVHRITKRRKPPKNKGAKGEEVREAVGPAKHREASFYPEWEEKP